MCSASKKHTGKKILFIHNRSSGKEGERFFDLQIEKRCDEKLQKFEIADSHKIKWPELKDKLSRENIDRIVIIGGDGALRFIMEKFYHYDIATEIAFIPKGSANIVARSLGIPLKFKKAFENAVNRPAHKIDIGLINDKHLFFLACACGQLAKLTTETKRADKKRLGAIAYIKNMKTALGPYKEKSIEIITEQKKHTLSAHSLIICNHLNLHLLKPKRGILHDDGILDLFIIKNKTFFSLLLAIKNFYRKKEKSNDTFEHIPFKKITIENNQLFDSIHVDGDIIRIDDRVTIKSPSHKMKFVY